MTEAFIKELHRTLKNGTSKSRQPWFAVGAYKKVANEAGGQTTPLPFQVPAAMARLLKGYNSSPEPDLEDLLDFHVCFERIHPFQDGNGLKEWSKVPGYLRYSCLLMQDDFKAVLDYFGIEYEK